MLRMYLTNLEDHADFFVDNLGSNVQEVRMSNMIKAVVLHLEVADATTVSNFH